MTFSKTISTFLATMLVGTVTFLFATPSSRVKSKIRTSKTITQKKIKEKEDLFI